RYTQPKLAGAPHRHPLKMDSELQIFTARDIDYVELLQLYPGQTKQSIQFFLTSMSRYIVLRLALKDPSFQEILQAAEGLNFSSRSPKTTTVTRNDQIIEMYKKIKIELEIERSPEKEDEKRSPLADEKI
ncbi:Uncharacterized protein FKW44_022311, partial [Caligus rogercresseyi]